MVPQVICSHGSSHWSGLLDARVCNFCWAIFDKFTGCWGMARRPDFDYQNRGQGYHTINDGTVTVTFHKDKENNMAEVKASYTYSQEEVAVQLADGWVGQLLATDNPFNTKKVVIYQTKKPRKDKLDKNGDVVVDGATRALQDLRKHRIQRIKERLAD